MYLSTDWMGNFVALLHLQERSRNSVRNYKVSTYACSKYNLKSIWKCDVTAFASSGEMFYIFHTLCRTFDIFTVSLQHFFTKNY